MAKPRVLFLQHEQRFFYWLEPGVLELYNPMVMSGLLGEVRTYPYSRDIRYFRALSASKSHDPVSGENFVRESLLANFHHCIAEFRPDLVVVAATFPHESIDPAILVPLKNVHRFKLMSVLWDHEEQNPQAMANDQGLTAISDFVAVVDSSVRVDRIRARVGPYADWSNVDAVGFLPTVPDPTIFAPSDKKRYDVTISGSTEGMRGDVYAALKQAGFNVHRSGGMMAGDHFLPAAEYGRVLAESRIVVNTQTLDWRVQLKGRSAQVLACGSFLLEQRNIETTRFLSDLDVEMWDDVGDLMQKTAYWLAHDEAREARARDCHQRFVARGGCERWTRFALDRCGLS